jgi:carboxyl-terminal processing protease
MRPSVLSAATVADAVRQINLLLSELKTSHTELFTPDEYQYYILLDVVGGGDAVRSHFWGSRPYYPGIGVFTRELDGHHFVDGVLEGSPAYWAGLLYGDELLLVDGKPYSPIAAFQQKIGTMVDLAFRRHANAEPQHVGVSVVPIMPSLAFSSAMTASTRVIERGGRSIGYIHIWASHDADSFKRALTNLELGNVPASAGPVGQTSSAERRAPKIDTLIVDMRGRIGGNIAVAYTILEKLDDKSYWGTWEVINRPSARVRFGGTTPHPVLRGHSVLLIDHHTRSAAETTAYGFKRGAFGTLIGTPTAGAVSSGVLYAMPGDLLLYVAVAGHKFDGDPIEGVGVAPDLRVERPLPYAAGADPVLDAAVEHLAKGGPKQALPAPHPAGAR